VALSAAARRELGARGRLAVMVETTVRDRAGYVDIRRIGITLRPG
jgi:hypothetical protein